MAYFTDQQPIPQVIGSRGADIPSAATLVIPSTGTTFNVTGSTPITAISAPGRADGSRIVLTLPSLLTLTAGATIKLIGGLNIVGLVSGKTKVELELNGSTWEQLNVKVDLP